LETLRVFTFLPAQTPEKERFGIARTLSHQVRAICF
jgi:hypothetical protein